MVDVDRRLHDEELVEPFDVLDMYRRTETQCLAHLLFDFRRHGERHLRHRITGGELQQ